MYIVQRTLENVEYCFITAKKFSSETEAYKFEKYLHNKYSAYNIDHSLGKEYISSGFTELYTLDVIFNLKDELNG